MLNKLFFPLLVILCCISNIASAQVTPDGILFQAVARDANGNAAAGRNIYAKVNLLKSTATGTSVYAESFKVVSTDDGVFTLSEFECLGACVNAPVVQINDDYFEDLTPEKMVKVLDDLKAGKSLHKGSQIGRQCSKAVDPAKVGESC